MNHFEGITVDDHPNGAEMLASYAAIRARLSPWPPARALPKPASTSAQPAQAIATTPPVMVANGENAVAGRNEPELAEPADLNRYIVYRNFGHYDVIEGRKLNGEPLSKDEARQVLEEEPPRKPPLPVKKIQRVVARHYNVSREDILSQRRTAVVVRPRQVAMYLAKTMTLHSYPEIGRRFAGRDHTTVLHAVRKITALAETDQELAGEIAEIREEQAEGRDQ